MKFRTKRLRGNAEACPLGGVRRVRVQSGVQSGIVRIPSACQCDIITSSSTLTTCLGECPGSALRAHLTRFVPEHAATGGEAADASDTDQNDSATAPPMLAYAPPRWDFSLGGIALADRVRYHVNVFWEKAPDRRTSRTLDWLNDACEARLDEEDRDQGKVTYAALMSSASIAFTFPSFDWKRPFRQAKRARQYTGGFPISLLVTKQPDTTGAGGTPPEIEPHVLLLGMKRGLGRRAAVRKYRRTDIQDAVKPETDDFQCTLHLSTGTIDVGFATKFEVNVLVECLKSKPKEESETAAAKSDS